MSKSGNSRVVIHNRRFWRVRADGRMEPIYLSERAKAHLVQLRAEGVRDANKTQAAAR